jgi:hypothetical protein
MRASPASSLGVAGAVYGGRSSQDHPMSLRLRPDGRRLKSVYVRVDAGMCRPSLTRTYNLPLHMTDHLPAVRSDGSFVETRPYRGQTQAGDMTDFKVVVRGTVSRTGAAGTIRVFGPVADSDGNVIDRCDSGKVRWRLRRGSTYGGATDADTAVSLRLARDRARLRSFFIDLLFVCDSRNILYSFSHLAIAVRRDGTISKHGYTLIPFKTPEGDSASGQYLLRGKVGARLASGTYRAFGTVLSPDGSKVSCDTGAVRWTARRG